MARFEEFWVVACDYRPYMWLGFMMMLFFFILTVMSLVLADQGSAAFSISMLNGVLTVVVGGILGWMFRVCGKREERTY